MLTSLIVSSCNNIAVVLVTLVSILYVVYKLSRRSVKNSPPGPFSIIGLGCPWKTGGANTMYIGLTKLREEYGDIYSINLSMPTIVLNTHELVREAFQKKGQAFSGKSGGFIAKQVIRDAGIITTDGRIWKGQRRFTMSAMRDLGMGKNGLIPSIQDEAADLVESIKSQNGAPFNPNMPVGIAVSNVICNLVFGVKTSSRYSETSTKLLNIFNSNATLPRASASFQLGMRFPCLRHLPGDFTGMKKLIRNVGYLKSVVDEFIEEHRHAFDPDHVTDFTYAYMLHMNQSECDPSLFNDHQMSRTVLDMFIAGSETTSTTLRWALLLMSLYPEIQKKVQEEIDSVLGRNRQPSSADRIAMPYTECVLMEIQRYGVLIPLVVHRAVETTEFQGYTIEKDTLVMANLWAIHRDKSVWPNPDQFDINNFMDEDGQPINKDKLAVFSIGKRQCAGESLARMELFVFFVTLMQNFTITPGSDDLNTILNNPDVGIVRSPKPFDICASIRM